MALTQLYTYTPSTQLSYVGEDIAQLIGEINRQAAIVTIDSVNSRVGVGVTPTTKLHVSGANYAGQDYVNGAAAGATLYLQDTAGLPGNGGQLLLGSGFGVSAGVKLYLLNGTGPAGALVLQTRNISGDVQNRVWIGHDGKVGIGTGTDALSGSLDINGSTLRLRTSRTIPTAAFSGTAGEVCWDASYVYVCVATNTWKRAAFSTW